MRRAAEPRHIEVEFDDPSDDDDDIPPMPNWRPPAHQGEAPAFLRPADEPPPLEDDPPFTLGDADPEPFEDEAAYAKDSGPRFRPVELGGRTAPKGGRFRLFAGLALGAPVGIALGWLGGWLARDGMTRIGSPAAAQIQMAALAPRPGPAPMPSTAEPTPIAAPESDAAPSSQELGPASTPPKTQEPAAAPPPRRRRPRPRRRPRRLRAGIACGRCRGGEIG